MTLEPRLETMCLLLVQSRSKYCVSFPNQPLSIQLFVIIIEKGVKGFTLLTVIPLAYASPNIWQGLRDTILDWQPLAAYKSLGQSKPEVERTNFHVGPRQTCINIFVQLWDFEANTADPVFHLYLCIEKDSAGRPGFELLKLVQLH